jgi:hypothetical protein
MSQVCDTGPDIHIDVLVKGHLRLQPLSAFVVVGA